MTFEDSTIGQVRAFAISAHGDQKDKNGRPYVEHLDAVALNTVRLFGFDPDLVKIAYLHDIVEDTKVRQDAIDAAFSEEIADAVDSITKRTGEPNYEYIAALCRNPLAAKVKLADLAHNTDPDRLKVLDPDTQARLRKKYFPAIYRLSQALGIESWISREDAEAAIRAGYAPSERRLSVGALVTKDSFRFVEGGSVWHVEQALPSYTDPKDGQRRRVLKVQGGQTLTLRCSHMVMLLPKAVLVEHINQAVSRYMGEEVKA